MIVQQRNPPNPIHKVNQYESKEMFALTTGEENSWLEKRKTVEKKRQFTKFCANIQKDLSDKNKFILQQEHVLDPINHFVQIFSYGIRC